MKDLLINKLNAILTILQKAAVEALSAKDIVLAEQIAIAALTHEMLCRLLIVEGPSDNVVKLVDDFGPATAELYYQALDSKVAGSKPTTQSPKVDPSTLN